MKVKNLAKIPTELYICVPRRSGRGVFSTNIWANLTRKDTGEGIGGKKLLSFLDGAKVSIQYTQANTGYAGPFDINPKTVGLHATQVIFEGDTQFEPCKSEEITLEVNPALLGTEIIMESGPITGYASLSIEVLIKAFEIAADGSRKTPQYSLPLELMVFDGTSIKRLQPVKGVMTDVHGTAIINYTFTKAGTYAIFVNFFGDLKHISAWSNNGRTTTITVIGGGFPLSWEETIVIEGTIKLSKVIKRIISQTEPTAPDGYDRAPEYDLDWGVMGKAWAYVKKATA